MSPQEFSDQFDVLVSSYRRFKDFDAKEELDSIEFNEYEKSVFLTKAQEELVRSLYNGKNLSGESFEETEELRRYLSNLVEEVTLDPLETSNGKPLGMESHSKFFTLPEDLWFITYEAVSLSDGKCEGTVQDVYPVRQDEYHKIKRNPFRGATERRALRLDLSEGIVEIVSKHTVTSYYVRYLKKLNPIVLVDLPNNLTIEDKGVITPCEVHEGLHHQILELAVQMALQSKGYSTESKQTKNSK